MPDRVKNRKLLTEQVKQSIEPLTRELLAQRAAERSSIRRPLIPRYVTQLHDAALRDMPGSCSRAVKVMQKAGIAIPDITDAYIPAAARALGEDWVQDIASFAQVTIGTGRLQSLLRDLQSEEPVPDHAGDPPSILVATAQNVHHTLGAMVVLGQLRRMGYSVRLMLDATPAAMRLLLQQTRFDAIFLSASLGDNPKVLRKLVDAMRKSLADPKATPIVLGGTLLETGPQTVTLIAPDHATSDIDDALRLCKLAITGRRSRAT